MKLFLAIAAAAFCFASSNAFAAGAYCCCKDSSQNGRPGSSKVTCDDYCEHHDSTAVSCQSDGAPLQETSATASPKKCGHEPDKCDASNPCCPGNSCNDNVCEFTGQ